MNRLVFAAVWCLLACVGAFAQQPDEPIKVETTLVSVPVTVSDRDGRYVSGLKASDFTLFDERVKQDIALFTTTEEPFNVALLLDTSRSTRDVLDDIKGAAKAFLRELRPTDRALVVSFDYRVQLLSPLTADRKALEKAVDRAEIGETFGTVLRDAVESTVKRYFAGVTGRKAIVLLTDGKDYGSVTDEDVFLARMEELDTPVYSIFYRTGPPQLSGGFGRGGVFGRRGGIFGLPRRPPPPDRTARRDQMNREAAHFLGELSEVTAGRSFESEVTDLKQTFSAVAQELRFQYRLGFYPADDAAPGPHRLKVVVGRDGTVVRARKSYRVGAATP